MKDDKPGSSPPNYSFDKISALIETDANLLKGLQKLKDKTFSDVISFNEKGEKLQWVNFVQEGGGTLGIALVGYTAVLELLGIRFLRLAGTSAGAINTLFLAAIGEKHEPKTPELYDMVTDNTRFNIRSFVDSRWGIVRRLIFAFGRNRNFPANLLSSLAALLIVILIPLPIIGFIGREGQTFYYVFLALLILIAGIAFFLFSRFGRFNYGINPGRTFYEFLVRELEKFGIADQQSLDERAKKNFKVINAKEAELETIQKGLYEDNRQFRRFLHIPKNGSDIQLFLNVEDRKEVTGQAVAINGGLSSIKQKKLPDEVETSLPSEISCDYSFVSTDIQNECKVVLPLDACHYFKKPENESPARYVRASMAIPFFFEPQKFPREYDAGASCDYCARENNELVIHRKILAPGRLIDGGSLSNFPINLFHQSHIKEPRIPIMGVRIQDSKPEKADLDTDKTTFGGFIGMIVNTLRNNEDNAFLAINPFYQENCIAHIDTYLLGPEIHWLNFDLTPEQKDKLFLKGAEAAIDFLDKFNWEDYKQKRKKL